MRHTSLLIYFINSARPSGPEKIENVARAGLESLFGKALSVSLPRGLAVP
jgi:hypothetical protein